MDQPKPLPAPDANAAAVDAFLKNVLRSGVLDRDRLQAALRGVPRELRGDPAALAEHLVRGGHLSRFQARRILKGKGKGLIMGPFQVLAPIGRGGMGTVFLARDGRSNDLIALKVLPRSKAEHRQRARFRREMQFSRRVDHPHLASTYSSGKIDETYYIAMEYIPGKSLQRLVSAEGPLDVPRAARLIGEVAVGLEHAHARGLIHRDLKPSNIMVTPHDHAKVLDLGLAIVEGEDVDDVRVVGGKGYIVGTMDYIAPEQTANSAAVDRRADIYSLGCTLYFSVTGRPPFPGGTSKEKIRRQRREEPESLLDLKPSLPIPFVILIRQMMAKDPAERPATAAEVAKRLRKWAGDALLPLDSKDDPEYSTAVLALQSLEPASDANVAESESSPGEDIVGTEWASTDLGEFAGTSVEPSWEELAPYRPWQAALFVTGGVLLAMALMGLGAALVLLLVR
jgi:serine/threonine protein kinase